MTTPSTWPGSVKLGLVLLAVAALFLPYAALCVGLAQLAEILR
jgi:hypothetical protein